MQKKISKKQINKNKFKLKEWMEPNSCHARNLVNIKSFITVCFSVGLHTNKQMAHHLKKHGF